MSAQSEQTHTLQERITARERTARKRAVVYTLIPIIMAVILLTYTAHQISSAKASLRAMEQRTIGYSEQISKQKATLQEQAQTYELQIRDLKDQVAPLEAEVASYNKQLPILKGEINSLRGQASKYQQTIVQLNRKIQGLQRTTQKLYDLQAVLRELEKNYKDRLKVLEAMKRNREEVVDLLQQKRKLLDDANAEVVKQNSMIEELIKDKEKLLEKCKPN
jgi:chromosome segregation ATPase